MRLMILISLAIALGSLDSANARVPVAAWRTGKRPRTEKEVDEQALVKLAHFSRKSLPVAAAMLAKRDDDNSGDGDESLHNPALPFDDEKAHLKNKKYAIKAKRDDDSDYSSSGDAAKIHKTSRNGGHEKRLSTTKSINKRVPADAPVDTPHHQRQFNSVLGIGIDVPTAGAGSSTGYGGWNQYVRPPWELSDDEEDEDYSDDSVDDDFKEKLKRNIGWMFPEPKDDAKKVAARRHATASEIVKRLQLLKKEMKEKN